MIQAPISLQIVIACNADHYFMKHEMGGHVLSTVQKGLVIVQVVRRFLNMIQGVQQFTK